MLETPCRWLKPPYKLLIKFLGNRCNSCTYLAESWRHWQMPAASSRPKIGPDGLGPFSPTTMADRRSEAADTRPTKRARTTIKPYTRDPRLWLEDGNIILVGDAPGSERLAFRVHRGILALNAEFFNDLVSFARHAPKMGCRSWNYKTTRSLFMIFYTRFTSMGKFHALVLGTSV